jgi:hypothetical protein
LERGKNNLSLARPLKSAGVILAEYEISDDLPQSWLNRTGLQKKGKEIENRLLQRFYFPGLTD